MRLDVGLKITDLIEAERVVGTVLDLNLEYKDDLELGGAYYQYEPSSLPEKGITTVRIRANSIPGIGWTAPERTDLALIVEIRMRGHHLLDLGRLAKRFRDWDGGEVFFPYFYTFSIVSPPEVAQEFWCAHRSQIQANPGVEDILVPQSSSSQSLAERATPLIAASPDPSNLLCFLTFGLDIASISEARQRVESLFKITLEDHDDQRIGGRYFTYRAPQDPSSPGVLDITLRSNALSQWTWLYPERQALPWLLDLQFKTADLSTLGALVATLEKQEEKVFQILCYRILGDILQDRVPRMVLHRFADLQDAAPLWPLGHRREQRMPLWIEEDEDQETEDQDQEMIEYGSL